MATRQTESDIGFLSVLDAFSEEEALAGPLAVTDGHGVWSGRQLLAARSPLGTVEVLSPKRFTSRRFARFARLALGALPDATEVHVLGVPMGVTGRDGVPSRYGVAGRG